VGVLFWGLQSVLAAFTLTFFIATVVIFAFAFALAFVTACNPLGKKLPAKENTLWHIALLAEIKKRSLFFSAR
jgi:hypothetical protein